MELNKFRGREMCINIPMALYNSYSNSTAHVLQDYIPPCIIEVDSLPSTKDVGKYDIVLREASTKSPQPSTTRNYDAIHIVPLDYCPEGHRGLDQSKPHLAKIHFHGGAPCILAVSLKRIFRLPPGHERCFRYVVGFV